MKFKEILFNVTCYFWQEWGGNSLKNLHGEVDPLLWILNPYKLAFKALFPLQPLLCSRICFHPLVLVAQSY